MVDPSDKGSQENKKTCSHCGTSKTPLWRGGPAGPKSLCNACGIRNRKKRRTVLGVKKGQNSNSTSSSCSNSSISNSSCSDKCDDYNNSNLGYPLKERIEVLMRRSSVDRARKKLGEEEQAAVLLMALSYGYVYA